MNGILKTQAEYYNDPVTYAGEGGTATNKAVIEDIFDLCAWHNITTNQPETYAVTSHKQYAVMVTDVNFNTHPTMKFGITDDTLLDMNFGGQKGELDGAGHTIYNLVVNSNTPTTSQYGIVSRGEVRNVNFKNVVFMGGSTRGAYPLFKTLTMNNCNVSAYLATFYFTSFIHNTMTINDCTFNVAGLVDYYGLLGGNVSSYVMNANRVRFHFSNLNVTGKASSSSSAQICANTPIATGTGGIFNSCAFTGLIYQRNAVTSTSSSHLSSAKHTNCYFALTTGITNYTNLFNASDSYITGMNLFDIDLLGGEYDDGNNYMCVHTSQLKNKDFLQLNGFITL